VIVYALSYKDSSGHNYFLGVFSTPKRARRRTDNFIGENTKGQWSKYLASDTRKYYDKDMQCTFYIQSQEVR
jgi:hypothetical protein